MLANGYTITALFLIAPKGWEYLNYFVMNWQVPTPLFARFWVRMIRLQETEVK